MKKRLQMAWDDAQGINPCIVYGSISGFGQDGPYGHRAGWTRSPRAWAASCRSPVLPGQGPVRVGVPINDLVAGTLLALGISMALVERARTGVGRWVTTSLLEAAVFMLDFQAARWLMAGEVAPQAGNDHPTGIPTGVFPTSDGHINIAASSARMCERFCDVIGRADWKESPSGAPRRARSHDRAAINAAIGEITQTTRRSTGSICLTKLGFRAGRSTRSTRCSPIHRSNTWAWLRPCIGPKQRVATRGAVASPLNFSGLGRDIRLPTPDAGDHTDEVLASVGYSEAEIAALREKGVV